jgi:hypothetical protein
MVLTPHPVVRREYQFQDTFDIGGRFSFRHEFGMSVRCGGKMTKNSQLFGANIPPQIVENPASEAG